MNMDAKMPQALWETINMEAKLFKLTMKIMVQHLIDLSLYMDNLPVVCDTQFPPL